MYLKDGLPLEVIGGRLGWHASTVGNALRKLDTPMRPSGENYYSPRTWQGKARKARSMRTETSVAQPNASEATYTEAYVKKRLLDIAWMGSEEEQIAEVECIMAQQEWRHLVGRVERVRLQVADDEQAELRAITDLYDRHVGPHSDSCPSDGRSDSHA